MNIKPVESIVPNQIFGSYKPSLTADDVYHLKVSLEHSGSKQECLIFRNLLEDEESNPKVFSPQEIAHFQQKWKTLIP